MLNADSYPSQRRDLDDRIADTIPPVDEDVVRHFIDNEILPISKLPRRMLVNIKSGHLPEHYILNKMDSYWLREAYLAFPRIVEDSWAFLRAVTCGLEDQD